MLCSPRNDLAGFSIGRKGGWAMTSASAALNQPVLSLRRAPELKDDPVEWTVDQIVPSGMLTLLSGKDKAGKTLLAWEIAEAVLQGDRFLGQFQARKGPVIFLGLDDPAVVTIDRLEQLGLRDEPDLHVATPMDTQPKHSNFWEEVRANAESIKPELVVVDSLYLFLGHSTDSMNQAGSMGPVMEPLNRLTEQTGASVLLITHDAKNGTDVAGSFVIRAAAKQILRLEANKGEPSGRTLQVEGKLIERCLWTLSFGGPGKWSLTDDEKQYLAQTGAACLEWLKQGNRGTSEDIAGAVQKRRTSVQAVLKQLVEEELVTVQKVKGMKGRPRMEYSIISVPTIE